MQCEICGKGANCIEIRFEGNRVYACERCSSLGKKVPQKPVYASVKRNEYTAPEKVVVTDFGQRIRVAREQKNLTMKEFAEKISEKESFLHKIESSQHKPSDVLIQKIENFLNISLTETVFTETQVNEKNDEKMTLWDIAKKK